MSALLEMINITKTFAYVRANDHITFRVQPGEVHGLLGENGAGKTTLMNVLYGLYQPDSGEIRLEGERVVLRSPRTAIDLGIGMVHQHFSLVPTLTVVENVALGLSPTLGPFVNIREVAQKITKISEAYGLDVESSAVVGTLPLGVQQRVEILKALYRQATLLIMDEPTAMLTPGEVRDLFAVLRKFKAEGRSVVFISHKLDEVLEISDRVTVLRDGRVVGTVETAEADRGLLAKMMVGREVTLKFPRGTAKAGGKVLEVRNLHVPGRPGIKDVSLTIAGGEIFGLAGVEGNGQAELAQAIAGLVRPTAGEILINGETTTQLSVRARKEKGVAYVPEDRQGMGVVLDFSVADNLVLRDIGRRPYSARGVINFGRIQSRALELCRAFDIRTPGIGTKVRYLSGGNQQRVVLARETSGQSSFLLAAHATRGLDVGATEYVFQRMRELRARGAAILYISSELEEILALSDRIGALFRGELVGVVPGDTADVEQIGLMMAGAMKRAG